ncbi:MAG: hypothetical protein IPI82_01955 [Candidatus Microthrix sp.]|nr:hypothetical protein [Candidatus Microthrix sp.]
MDTPLGPLALLPAASSPLHPANAAAATPTTPAPNTVRLGVVIVNNPAPFKRGRERYFSGSSGGLFLGWHQAGDV